MSDKKIALFTGSFDPVTLGHMDLIERASHLFDQLYIGIFYNVDKKGCFSLEQRQFMLEKAVNHLTNVKVIKAKDSMAVDIARKINASYFVRGLRNGNDLAYEANLEYFNKYLASEVETVYLMASHKWQEVSSSRIREMIHFKSDISEFVPNSVFKEVEKINDQKRKI